MSDVNEEGRFVCFECVREDYLSKQIKEEGKSVVCYYCQQEGACIAFDDLADQVHGVLEEQFSMTSSNPSPEEYYLAKEGLWEQPGEPVVDVIGNLIESDSVLAEDIRDHLSELHGFEAVKDGGEDPYSDDAMYEENDPDVWGLRDSWASFKDEVRARARFFSVHAQTILEELFKDLNHLTTFDGKSVIRVVGPDSEDRFIFRGRIAYSEADIEKFLKSPERELGAPPSRTAKSGRMNAAGISVFYGGLDAETCVAEVRAPVGSSVVLGKFELIRQVRLLDFDILNRVYIKKSRFEPDYKSMSDKAAFLAELVSLISMPVMPADEEYEYLPTQVVAEYLAERTDPKLDGIVFHSSQTGGNGRNVVLFNHSSRSKVSDLPQGTKVDVFMGGGPEDDYDSSITVFEEIPETPPPGQERNAPKAGPFDGPLLDIDDMWWVSTDQIDYREETLRLDVGKIEIWRMTAVKYDKDVRHIMRHKITKRPAPAKAPDF